MKTCYQRLLWRSQLTLLTIAIAVGHSTSGFAAEQVGFRKAAGEFSVYLTVMPTEFLVGPQSPQKPGATPYLPPSASDMHHVMVSLFEYRNGRRVAKTNGLCAGRRARILGREKRAGADHRCWR